ncbi:MAG: aminodeoxychorismate lyase [Alkalimonas sp.]|nr:aminodeoxychorismate lyase [Alkalimonas sp.]
MLVATPSVGDRSFQFGDGIFSTIRVSDGHPELWPLHLSRLQAGVERLGICAPDWLELTKQVQQAVTAKHQVLKVMISRGHAGRGYSPAGVEGPDVFITTAELPDYRSWQQQGIRLGLANLQLACQPVLAGLKHNNRLEQVLLKQELVTTEWDDLLVLDQQGYITEATAANLFFYRQQQWFTPQLQRAGVAGVMRAHLMTQLATQEVNWTLPELEQVEAIFICNALCGVVPVRQFQHRTLNIAAVQRLQQELLC